MADCRHQSRSGQTPHSPRPAPTQTRANPTRANPTRANPTRANPTRANPTVLLRTRAYNAARIMAKACSTDAARIEVRSPGNTRRSDRVG